jgi:hypothetical protein
VAPVRGWSSLVLALLLAGCGQASTEAPAGTEGTSATTGAIAGVAVDEAVRPLVAALDLDGQWQAASTEDGTFRFEDIPAGSHVLSASAKGFLPAQALVTVVAGQTVDARVQLLREPSDLPFFNTVDFEGFYQLSLGLATAVGDQLNDPLGLLECSCAFSAQPGPGLSRMVLEVFWDDSVADPAGPTKFTWQIEAVGGNATATGQGPSPIQRTLGRLDFPAEGFEFSDASEYQVRVYPDAVWPAFSQDFQAFLSLWYRGPPPDGWSVNDP